MGLHQLALLPNYSLFNVFQPPQAKPLLFTKRSSYVLPTIQCKTPNISDSNQTNNVRRSANFQPSSWSYDYIQSLRSDYGEESYIQERDRLKEEIRLMISKMTNDLDKLELIDVLQKLGVAAHFRREISNILENVYHNNDRLIRKDDLYASALEFRLFRQHGYYVSSEVFKSFQDDKGNFNTQLSVDMEGMLSLYEASFLSLEGETIFNEAREFCYSYLKEFVYKNKNNEISVLINHALERPLHWRVPRLEARWFIDFYERSQNTNPTLLKLAKLDFNIVQVAHQDDIKYVSSWWKETGLREKLSFARDRPMESFFWSVNMAYQPDLEYCRRELAKAVLMLVTLDDIYDVYGELEELELFTEVVERWDVNAIDILPEYMKLCFLALYNFVNEVGFDNMKTGYNIILCLKKTWADLCKSFLTEAKWYYNDYIPSMKEYMENAWISTGGVLLLVQSYVLIPNSIRKDIEFSTNYPNLFCFSSTIFRLANDLGSYKREMEIGDAPTSIICYMNETGASEADACEHVKFLMCQTWKQMNEEVLNSPFSQSFTEIALNLSRNALLMYQHGDAYSNKDSETKNHMLSLLVHPIPMYQSTGN